MADLHALLACSIVYALEEREDVIVAPGCADALCAALEPIVAQCIPSLTRPLRTGRVQGLFPTLPGERRTQLHRVLDATAKQVAALLLTSDHVDDIFADELTIRQDVLRAMRELLIAVLRGEVQLEDAATGSVLEQHGATAADGAAHGATGSWRPPTPAPGNGRSSWRTAVARRSDPVGGPSSGRGRKHASSDGQLDYFLDNLERALCVLEEYGEGPPSAPAAVSNSVPPPPPELDNAGARAHRGPSSKRTATIKDHRRASSQSGATATRTAARPLTATKPARRATGGRDGAEPETVRSRKIGRSTDARIAPRPPKTVGSDAKGAAPDDAPRSNGRREPRAPVAHALSKSVPANKRGEKVSRSTKRATASAGAGRGARVERAQPTSAPRRQARGSDSAKQCGPVSQGRRKTRLEDAGDDAAPNTVRSDNRRVASARCVAGACDSPRRRTAACGSRAKR